MAYNNPYGSQTAQHASGTGGRALPSPVGPLDRQSQHSSSYSPQYAQFPSPNGSIPTNADSKSGLKRKRSTIDAANRQNSEDSYTDGDNAQASSGPISASSAHHTKAGTSQQQETKKRTKTQRACDKCRTKKIRCDVLPDTDPPLCAHCKQYNYDCTFFLPIQETRFKKKRQDEESALQLHGRSYGSGPSTERREPQVDVRTYGPTSIPFMINSTANLHISSLDGLHPRSIWNVVFAGDGYIKVGAPPPTSVQEVPSPTKAPDIRVERDIVERLINSYFTNIAPIFPVITKAEFVAFQPSPPPILLYSICLMAASLRDTPPGLFDLFRKTVSSLIRSEDVLSTPTMANIQALLILSMSGDCHGTQTGSLMSFAWTRTGTAIRMAQDLNLHRAEISKEGTETRRRVWATCVVVDRWYSAAFGYPQMIDLTDCDVRLPTPQDKVIGYLNALTRLSILLGEVLKAIYSPTGLFSVTDSMLHDILSRLDHWK
ncbi:hypothetical protein FRC16_005664, partial [Serendipita sp. 398]